MSLSLSKTDICNGALQLCGQESITDLDTDDSEEAAQCRIAYLRSRNDLLERHPWKFAQRTAALTQDVTATNPNYSFSYQLPADFIALRDADADLNGFIYVLEGDRIVTDQSGFVLSYTREAEEVGFYSMGFVRALEHHIAGRVAFALTKDKVLTRELREEAANIFHLEAARDSQYDRNDTYVIDVLSNVRIEGS